ncbi:hypothetical protein QVD17_13157 [Tagetes erecta]|uniref:RRM domain-containing protein n=1 Tax=Tagetes erecta TaxID=13708 RepID=A0AAD8KWS3_TARER|nr:hypothetical protein QVD17_13157 [Tagetes erecta]
MRKMSVRVCEREIQEERGRNNKKNGEDGESSGKRVFNEGDKGNVNSVNATKSNGDHNNQINKIIKDRVQSQRGCQSTLTSFYISNLPENCIKGDLKVIFKEFGKIKEIYIAGKKNREGLWFGFVRFTDIHDASNTEEKMQGIKFFNRILQVNVARYNRNGDVLRVNRGGGDKQHFQSGPNYGLHTLSHLASTNRNSFRDALLKNTATTKEKVITVDLDDDSPMKARYHASLIARTKSLGLLSDIKILAEDAGVANLQIRYLGGLFILLSFPSQLEANGFLLDKQIWDGWFTKVEAWHGQSIPFERVAWLRIHGVPPHLWNPSVFNKIGSSFGRLLQPAESSWDDGNFSYGCVGILASNASPINDDLSLRWGKKSFRCWINESPVDWYPGCLDKGSGSIHSRPLPNQSPASSKPTDPVGSHPVVPNFEFLGSKSTVPLITSPVAADMHVNLKETPTMFPVPAPVPGDKGHLTVDPVSPINTALNVHAPLEAEVSAALLKGQHHFSFLGLSPPLAEQRCTLHAEINCHAFIAKGGSNSNKRARKFKKKYMGRCSAPCGPYSDSDSSGPLKAQRPIKRPRPVEPITFLQPLDPLSQSSPFSGSSSIPSSSHFLTNPGPTQLGSTEMESSAVPNSVTDSLERNALDGSGIYGNDVASQGQHLINNIDEEIEATKSVAECIGVHLNGHEHLIRDVINADGAANLDQ